MITFRVEDHQGEIKVVEIPEDINLSLMEALVAADYPIAATCGGMALCATCHIEVMDGIEKLNSPTEAELDMLDTLPVSGPTSRLACQIRINPNLENILLRLHTAE